MFRDARFQSKLAEVSMPFVGFGVVFVDLESDGDLDVVVANGHILHNAEQFQTGTSYAQVNQVFENRDGGVFAPVADSGVDQVRVSRGLAVSDLDLDGDQDLVISNSNDVAEVYQNLSIRKRPWAAVRLRDETSKNRSAIGARATVGRPATDEARGEVEGEAGEVPFQMRELGTGGSYLSQSSADLWFAVGTNSSLEIEWPRGGVTRLRRIPGDHRFSIRRW